MLLSRMVDERFLEHRRRSTSAAGIVGGILAILLFAYRFYFEHHWSWDLFAVDITIVCVKLTLMVYYRLAD